MPIKASILARVTKTLSTPLPVKRNTSVSSGRQTSLQADSITKVSNHVQKFLELEAYLCQKLKVRDTAKLFKERVLDQMIMAWALKVPIRYKKWEVFVRTGQRLKELQFFASSLSDE